MRHSVTIILCLLHCVARGQSFPFIGARANGLAYASSCLSDEWSVFNNPAGASSPGNHLAAVTVDVLPGFKAWNRMGAVYLFPFAKGGINAGVFKSGDALYSEQTLSAAYANKFGITSLGISAQLIQYHAEGFGSTIVPSVTLGGITELYPWLTLGACVVNITQPEIAEDERVPATLVAGVAVTLSDNVRAFAEVQKLLPEKSLLKAAVEYEFHKKFTLRTGFHYQPVAGFFGLGFRRRKIVVDYAVSYLENIGLRHQTGISYRFNQSK